MNDEDAESRRVQVAGFAVREASRRASSAGAPRRRSPTRSAMRASSGSRASTRGALTLRLRDRGRDAGGDLHRRSGPGVARRARPRRRRDGGRRSRAHRQSTAGRYEARDLVGAPRRVGGPDLPRRRLRLRHEAEHPSPARRLRDRERPCSRPRPRRRDRGGRVRRGVPVQRAGRPGRRPPTGSPPSGSSSGRCRSSGSVWATSCSRSRSAGGPTRCGSATAA